MRRRLLFTKFLLICESDELYISNANQLKASVLHCRFRISDDFGDSLRGNVYVEMVQEKKCI